MDSRYNKAIKRNLEEIANLLLERGVLASIEHYEKMHGKIYCLATDFFSILYNGLFNDMIAHSIKVLDKDMGSASFWYIYRADEGKLKKLKSYSERKIKFLERLTEKLKHIRDKTHFHIDKKGMLNPKIVWSNADVKAYELLRGVKYLWGLLSELHVNSFNEKFCDFPQRYNNKDISRILDFAVRNKIIHVVGIQK